MTVEEQGAAIVVGSLAGVIAVTLFGIAVQQLLEIPGHLRELANLRGDASQYRHAPTLTRRHRRRHARQIVACLLLAWFCLALAAGALVFCHGVLT